MMVPGLPQWAKTLPPNAGSVGSILGQGTKVPHAVECGLTLKKKKIAASLQSQLLTAGVAATIKRPGPAHSPVTPVPLGFQHSSIEEPAGTVKFFHFTLSVQVRKNPR